MATVELAREQLLIGGSWRDASSGASYEKRNPFTGEPVETAAAATREDARAAVEAAKAAFPEWSAKPASERRAVLDRAGDLLMERAPEIAAIVAEETGGTFGWGMF